MIRVLVLVSLLVGCVQDKSADKNRRAVATVNGTPVYLDAFEREFHRLRFDDEGGLPSIASVQAQKQALVKDMIDRRLLSNEAERHNVLIGIDEVNAAYERTRSGWDDTEIKELLEKKDVTPAELKRELRELMMIHKYLKDHVFSRIAVTDEEISTHLQAHPEVQIFPEAVHAYQIVVKTEEKANSILREIRGGVSFEDAAMKHSLSPEAKTGGDLGFFTRGTMPSVFDEVCFSLRTGTLSKVVSSDYGYHLFKVVERRPEGLKSVTKVRDEVEHKLRGDKERTAHLAKLEELRKNASITVHDKELARVR